MLKFVKNTIDLTYHIPHTILAVKDDDLSYLMVKEKKARVNKRANSEVFVEVVGKHLRPNL